MNGKAVFEQPSFHQKQVMSSRKLILVGKKGSGSSTLTYPSIVMEQKRKRVRSNIYGEDLPNSLHSVVHPNSQKRIESGGPERWDKIQHLRKELPVSRPGFLQ